VTVSRDDRGSGKDSIVTLESVGKSVIYFSMGESIFGMSSVSDCFEVAGMASIVTADLKNIASQLTVILRVKKSISFLCFTVAYKQNFWTFGN
jgi:hypothetical protein